MRTVSAVHAHTGLVLLLFIDFLASHRHPILVGSFTFLDFLKKNYSFLLRVELCDNELETD